MRVPPECPAVAQALVWARDGLRVAGTDTHELDAEALLAHVLGRDRAWLYAHPEHPLAPAQMAAYVWLVHRRAAHTPVAYLLGHKEFFGLDFLVTPAALVPRPETELLIETALELVPNRGAVLKVADPGTGSGILAVTLAVHLLRARLLASDISAAALLLARSNAVRHGVADRVACVQADLLQPFDTAFDLIVSNPPYLRGDELPVFAPSPVLPLGGGKYKYEVGEAKCDTPLAWEPRAALDGGSDGMAVIRRLLPMAARRLRPGGALIMEMGNGQGRATLELARALFRGADAAVRHDYAGHERVLVLTTPDIA
jgi:release factor glutamine methyltransferase